MPLSTAQVRQLAANLGVRDPDKLLSDLVAHDALDFVRRPLDLIDVCADWNENRQIRCYRERVGTNIERKLAARVDRDKKTPLALTKAREGASQLALAAFLTRKLGVRHGSEADRAVSTGAALDPAKVLPHWSPDEQQTLLERSLFAFASYGLVRFHHRSVAEFLAAERLNALLKLGMPMRAVKRLLFAEADAAIKIIRPRLRPIAAWLAAQHSAIFEEVLDREPDVMLDHADPSVLEPEAKRRVLRAFVERYGPGGARGLYVPRQQVNRFASPDLATEVERLWSAGIENPDMRKFLCELVGAGRLASCSQIAKAAAQDPQEDESVRLAAIRALTKVDRSSTNDLVESMIANVAMWPDSMVERAIRALFPVNLRIDQLVLLLKRRAPSRRRSDSFEWFLGNAIAEAQIEPEGLMELCVGLKGLVEDGLTWVKSGPHIQTQCPELILSLADVCLRLFELQNFDTRVLEAATLIIKVADHSHRAEKKIAALKERIGGLSGPLRETVFWLADAMSERLHTISDPWNRLYEATYHGPISLSFAQDQEWIAKTLADTTRPRLERAMMLDAMAASLSHQAESRIVILTGLKQHVLDDADLTSQLENFLKPMTVDPQHAEFEREQARRRLEDEQKKAAQHAEWAAFERRVKDDPDTAFGEEKAYNTCWNLWNAMRRSEDGRDDAGWDPTFIEAHFGPEIVARLRNAMRLIWRKYRPTLWHERAQEERNTHYTIWDFGLAALFAEAEDPNWARSLSVADAELAARYAPVHLNGLPTWLEALIQAHADAVERTLGPAVIAELDETIDTGAAAMTLQSVRYSPAPVAKIFVPWLKDWLFRHHRRFIGGDAAPPGLSRLWHVSDILVAYDGDASSWLVPIAESALSGTSSKAFDTFWLSVLFRLDPAKGTDALERQLTKTEPAHVDLAVGWFAGMFGDSREPSVDLSHAGFTPDILSRLVKLAYRYVRPDGDPVHEGAFSPGPRDDAASARNRLLGAFLDTKGQEAWRLKIEMADDPLIAHFRDRFRLLIREKLAEEVDWTAMSDEEASGLDRNLDVGPKTRDEMFRVLCDRLDDLDGLLTRDTGPREMWAVTPGEKLLRRAIAHELQEKARGAYAVTQEEVTADENETDIRLRSTASDQQGVIELKVAEKGWSGAVLRDRLRTQIVAKYMAPENCRAGCLLVTVASNRGWEHPDTGKSLNIDGLRDMLESEAKKIEAERGGTLRLFVKILDLCPRLSMK